MCKAQNEQHAKVLSHIGAEQIIMSAFDMGRRIAHSLAQKNIIDLIELSSDCSVVEIALPNQWADKSISGNNLHRMYRITVLAIRNESSKKIKNSPSADEILKDGDILVVIGSNKDLAAIDSMS